MGGGGGGGWNRNESLKLKKKVLSVETPLVSQYVTMYTAIASEFRESAISRFFNEDLSQKLNGNHLYCFCVVYKTCELCELYLIFTIRVSSHHMI